MEVIYIFVVAFFIWLIFKPKSDVGKVRVNTKYNKKEAGPRKETVTVLRSSSAEKKSDEQNKVDTGACDENDKENIQLTRNNLSRISSKKKASIDSAKNSDKAKIAEEKEIDVRDNPIQAPNSSTTTKTASNYLTSQLASQPQLTSTSSMHPVHLLPMTVLLPSIFMKAHKLTAILQKSVKRGRGLGSIKRLKYTTAYSEDFYMSVSNWNLYEDLNQNLH